MKQQAERRKEILTFREKRDAGDMAITAKNFKAMQQMDKYEIETLSKVIENSIVFTLSKSGKFSQFDNTKGGKVSNAQKRKRKFMIGMSKEVHAHEYKEDESCASHEHLNMGPGDSKARARETGEFADRILSEMQEIDLQNQNVDREHHRGLHTGQTEQSETQKDTD